MENDFATEAPTVTIPALAVCARWVRILDGVMTSTAIALHDAVCAVADLDDSISAAL